MSDTAKILLVDDEPGMLRYIRTLLEVDDYKVETASTGEEAVERVQKGMRPELVLLDLLMPGIDGLQTLEQLRKIQPNLKVVMLSCVSDTRKVVQAIRLGAHDYLTKPFQKAELDAVIDQCLGTNQQNYPGEVEELAEDVFFVAASPVMRKLRSQAALVANVDIPVLMLGESGTGKEVMARLIHKLSPRAHRTFLKVNCAAVSETLIESEFFGHEKGSFTGASDKHLGKFQEADGGTLFLDEIGELRIDMQVKLLRALQEGEVDPIGSKRPTKVDVRIISATNRDLAELTREGQFREDLYYRLNVFPVFIPPLRQRREDVPALARFFIARFAAEESKPVAGLTPEATDLIENFDWRDGQKQLAALAAAVSAIVAFIFLARVF